LKREESNAFDYNRIFSLLFSFDHLVEQKCPDLVSGPKYQARKKCQAEIIAQIEGLISNPNSIHAKKEQYRDFKRAVSKFTYSYELNIKTLFDKNESLLIFCRPPHWCDYDAFAKRAAAFRNAVAHGNPSGAEALTYSDYVLLEKIIVFLMFYDERGNEDFVTYLDGILDA